MTQAVQHPESDARRDAIRATRLHARLDACAAHDAEYGADLSNHLPMLLHALDELGASGARQDAFAAWYAQRLRPASASPEPRRSREARLEPDAGNGAGPRLGHYADHAAWLAHYRSRVRRHGVEATVAAALPTLMPGVSAAAFHGLLRTAHGVAARHTEEVAQGLAYWAARHQVLLPPCPTGTLPLDAWWAGIQALGDQAAVQGGLISHRMRAWAGRAGFAEAAGALAPEAETLPGIATLSARLYAAQGDFTVLHVLTSSWAMRTLAPLQADAQDGLRHYAAAVAAGWLGSARTRPATATQALEWDEIVARAVAAQDDHIAKLVYACKSWSALTGEAAFAQAATRAVAPTVR